MGHKKKAFCGLKSSPKVIQVIMVHLQDVRCICMKDKVLDVAERKVVKGRPPSFPQQKALRTRSVVALKVIPR
jgi:hypothetical protein